jgi:hypothetical protein
VNLATKANIAESVSGILGDSITVKENKFKE